MRYFTLEEAARVLPEIERHLRDALYHKAEYQRTHQELERTRERVRQSGGARLDPARQRELRATHDSSAGQLQRALGEIQEAGALVKDLDIGLIDFLCLYHGREVCLCWKLGEDHRMRFWHGTEEGFRGRKPIDEEFRKNHRGDSIC